MGESLIFVEQKVLTPTSLWMVWFCWDQFDCGLCFRLCRRPFQCSEALSICGTFDRSPGPADANDGWVQRGKRGQRGQRGQRSQRGKCRQRGECGQCSGHGLGAQMPWSWSRYVKIISRSGYHITFLLHVQAVSTKWFVYFLNNNLPLENTGPFSLQAIVVPVPVPVASSVLSPNGPTFPLWILIISP